MVDASPAQEGNRLFSLRPHPCHRLSDPAGGRMVSPAIVVVTGPKESGKSTFCRELARTGVEAGLDVAGIVTTKEGPPARVTAGPAAPWGGPAAGRLVVTNLRTGRQSLLGAWTGTRWAMEEAGLAAGREALAAAVPCDLLIIDEIGRLELDHGRGWPEAFKLLAQGGFGQAVVTVREGYDGALLQALAQAQALTQAAPPSVAPQPQVVRVPRSPAAWQGLLQAVLARGAAPSEVVGL